MSDWEPKTIERSQPIDCKNNVAGDFCKSGHKDVMLDQHNKCSFSPGENDHFQISLLKTL